MRVLFDQGTPVPLRTYLSPHLISTAYEMGWSALKNGELLSCAETAGFEVLITTDTNLKYQQNLATRKIAVLVLSTTSWPRIKNATGAIADALAETTVGSYLEITIP